MDTTGKVGRWLVALLLVGQFALAQRGAATSENGPRLRQGLEKLSVLDFTGAYQVLAQIDQGGEPTAESEAAKSLRSIVSLGKTVAHLRLLHAYVSQLARLGSLEHAPAREEGVTETLRSYVQTYQEKVGRWATRLGEDTETLSHLRQDVAVSVPYPGVRDLPSHVQAGLDRLDILREGIVPVPSQVANIEEAETYAAVLAAFYLAVDQEYVLPAQRILLQGTVVRSRLLFYSALWLNNVADLLEAVELRRPATSALEVVLRLEAMRPDSALRGRALELLRHLEKTTK